MSNSKSESAPLNADFPHGIRITDRGLLGRVVEVTCAHAEAVERHARVIETVDSLSEGPPGGKLILLLVINELILDHKRLLSSVSKSSTTYRHGEDFYLEFECDGGWRDRRIISPQTSATIEANNGSKVSAKDWQWATKTLREIHPLRPAHLTWNGFLSDARSWWYPRSPGPLVDHAFGLSPFQVLSRAALARRANGAPQNSPTSVAMNFGEDGVALAQTTIKQTGDLSIFEELKVYAGQVARTRCSKDAGREKIIIRIQQQLPVAAEAGRVQVIVLGAIQHAIQMGGVRGDPWAPITVYEYMRQGICELVATFLKLELDTMDCADFHRVYTELLETIPKSQRSKFEAFLLAFHRYLVICGFDHLPRALSGKKELLPPTAAVVWEHELDLALTYVDAVAPTPRVALQAKLGLALGYNIPFRTVEIWCIRMCDVHIKNPMFVSVYTRQRDGVGKVKSLRRQEDIVDGNLKELLLDMVNMRSIEDDAGVEDLLLGQPYQPDKRHAQLVTAQLMNDALKWATGDASASFYDLRHSVFSRRASKVLEEAIDGH